MSKDQFLMRWKHEWRGLLLDSLLAQKTGAERSLYLRQLEAKIDGNIQTMFDDAQPNGAPKK